jgi:hypothetical protein
MKEIIRIDRESMIEALIQSDFDHFEMCPTNLESIFRSGFLGYENYSDEDLIFSYRDYISEDPTEDIEIVLQKD